MRYLLHAFGLAFLACLPAVSPASAGETATQSPVKYDLQFTLVAGAQYVDGQYLFHATTDGQDFGGPYVDDTGMEIIQGFYGLYQATRVSSSPPPPEELEAAPESIILAGTSSSVYEKPEDMTPEMWAGFWHSAAEFHLGELEIYIYNARADRVHIKAKREVRTKDDENASAEAESEFEDYGEVESALSCPPLEPQNYMLRLEGYNAARLVRQGEFYITDMPSTCVYQVCGPDENRDRLVDAAPSCLMIILPSARHDHPLDWHIDQALGGLPVPPLDTMQLGPFELHYYFPESHKLVFSLWKLDGEWREDWENYTPLACQITLTNAQPPPPE